MFAVHKLSKIELALEKSERRIAKRKHVCAICGADKIEFCGDWYCTDCEQPPDMADDYYDHEVTK
jgi:hypothetical protein